MTYPDSLVNKLFRPILPSWSEATETCAIRGAKRSRPARGTAADIDGSSRDGGLL